MTGNPAPFLQHVAAIVATDPVSPFGPSPSIPILAPLGFAFVIAGVVSLGRVLRDAENDPEVTAPRLMRRILWEIILGGFSGVAFPLFIDTFIYDLEWPGALLFTILGGAIGFKLLLWLWEFFTRLIQAVKNIKFESSTEGDAAPPSLKPQAPAPAVVAPAATPEKPEPGSGNPEPGGMN